MSAGLRTGYKQSEVGVIPEDWDVKRIADIASVGSGGTPRREVAAYWGGSIPWITTSQVDFGAISEADQFITDEGLQNSPAKLLPPGTLLMALYGQGKTRGKVGVLAMQAATNQACASISLYEGVSREFVLHFLTSRYEQIRNSSNSGSQENLNGNIVKGTLIALPPLPEQRAIAAALSDVDALLGGLDSLIAKKQGLKVAAMQQLLTGQTRLPGFSGEWEVKRLGEVFIISAGKAKSEHVVIGGRYWVVDMGSVSTSGKLIVSKTTNFYGDFLRIGDLVMPKDDIGGGGIIGRVGFINADETYVLGDHVYRLLAIRGMPLFLSYVINAHKTNSALRKKVIGSAQLGLGRKSVEDQEIPFPPEDEQTAIAAILSDMDTELAALQARRSKTQALKQAMMQELLTGRIRLVRVRT